MISGLRPSRRWASPIRQPEIHAARRPSSTVRSSIRTILQPTSLRSQSSASRKQNGRNKGRTMSVTVLRRDHASDDKQIAQPPAATRGRVVTLDPPRAAGASRLKALRDGLLANIVPPLIVVAILLLIWQIGFGRPGASLPPPSTVWSEAKDLILEPFFINGPQDIGLGWRVLTSLQRVACLRLRPRSDCRRSDRSSDRTVDLGDARP